MNQQINKLLKELREKFNITSLDDEEIIISCLREKLNNMEKKWKN